MNHKRTTLLFLVLILLVLAACSPAKPTANFPTGKLTEPDNQFAGFVFNEDGTWAAVFAGESVAGGTYRVDGDNYIEETNDQGCPSPMTYKYTFDGKTLTFELTDESKDDPCDPRREGFDGGTYVLNE